MPHSLTSSLSSYSPSCDPHMMTNSKREAFISYKIFWSIHSIHTKELNYFFKKKKLWLRLIIRIFFFIFHKKYIKCFDQRASTTTNEILSSLNIYRIPMMTCRAATIFAFFFLFSFLLLYLFTRLSHFIFCCFILTSILWQYLMLVKYMFLKFIIKFK